MQLEKNKKVCMFVWNNFVNDARVYKECRTLLENGYRVTLLCLKYEHDSTEMNSIEDDITIKRVYTKFNKSNNIFRKLIFYIVPIIKMATLGVKENADYYHANDLNTLFQGIIGAKFRLKKRKLIYDSHEVQTDRSGYTSKKIKYIESILLNFVDSIIMTTKTRADYVKKLYNIDEIKIVHNYPMIYDIDELNPIDLFELCNIPKDKKILLYQGGIQEGRGIENLIYSMQEIELGVLVIIGNGSLKQNMIDLVIDLKIENKVKFIDAVDKHILKDYTAAADIGFQVLQNTCFNHYSAVSNKLFEYIMAGVPVIASKGFPEIERIISESKCGILVDTTETKNIAVGVNEILKNDSKFNKLKNDCIINRERYIWESKSFLEVYNENK